MDNPERLITAIHKLLSPFPAGSTQGSAEDVMRRYLEVATTFDADIVDRGVALLLDGSIPSYDGRFAPTPPQLGTACRKAGEFRARERYIEGFGLKRLPAPDIVKTPEQRAKAKAQVAAFVASQGPALSDQRQIDAASREKMAKHDSFFAEDFVPTPGGVGRISKTLAAKLGYSVGSPESEREAS